MNGPIVNDCFFKPDTLPLQTAFVVSILTVCTVQRQGLSAEMSWRSDPVEIRKPFCNKRRRDREKHSEGTGYERGIDGKNNNRNRLFVKVESLASDLLLTPLRSRCPAGQHVAKGDKVSSIWSAIPQALVSLCKKPLMCAIVSSSHHFTLLLRHDVGRTAMGPTRGACWAPWVGGHGGRRVRSPHSQIKSAVTDYRRSSEVGGEGISETGGRGDNRKGGTYLFGKQGDEVPLKLRLDHLHHMLDLRGLAAVDQLIQRQQLLWARPALSRRQRGRARYLKSSSENAMRSVARK